MGLVALAPFQSDVEYPAGDCFQRNLIGADRKVIGNGAAGRQTGFGVCPGIAGNPGGADAEVFGLDQAVTNYGGAFQTVAEFPDVSGPSVGQQFIEGVL